MADLDESESEGLTDSQRKHLEEFSKWMRETLGDNIDGTFADNDWTFIVKLHAMIETALNATLVMQFDAQELSL